MAADADSRKMAGKLGYFARPGVPKAALGKLCEDAMDEEMQQVVERALAGDSDAITACEAWLEGERQGEV